MNQPWLRAGLIGAGAIIVVNLLGLVMQATGLPLLLQLIALTGVGILAASFMLPPRSPSRGAGQGALAGLLAGLVDGICVVLLVSTQLAQPGTVQTLIAQLPPQYLQAYSQAGIDPATMFSPALLTATAGLCCLPGSLIAGALLGALGGLIYSAARPE